MAHMSAYSFIDAVSFETAGSGSPLPPKTEGRCGRAGLQVERTALILRCLLLLSKATGEFQTFWLPNLVFMNKFVIFHSLVVGGQRSGIHETGP